MRGETHSSSLPSLPSVTPYGVVQLSNTLLILVFCAGNKNHVQLASSNVFVLQSLTPTKTRLSMKTKKVTNSILQVTDQTPPELEALLVELIDLTQTAKRNEFYLTGHKHPSRDRRYIRFRLYRGRKHKHEFSPYQDTGPATMAKYLHHLVEVLKLLNARGTPANGSGASVDLAYWAMERTNEYDHPCTLAPFKEVRRKQRGFLRIALAARSGNAPPKLISTKHLTDYCSVL